MGDAAATYGPAARHLIRSRDHGALGTSLDGRPYVSLVATACDHAGNPLLLLSDLAQHTRNLLADPRVSLLFEDTGSHPDPLAGPRLTVVGRVEGCDDSRLADRFVARHPSSAVYVGFGDFHLYRVIAERGHLVAGFGRIAWVESHELRVAADTTALAAAEGEIVTHLNAEHAAALTLCAQLLLGRQGDGWLMTGIDAEGLDLRRDGEVARLDFAAPGRAPAPLGHAAGTGIARWLYMILRI